MEERDEHTGRNGNECERCNDGDSFSFLPFILSLIDRSLENHIHAASDRDQTKPLHKEKHADPNPLRISFSEILHLDAAINMHQSAQVGSPDLPKKFLRGERIPFGVKEKRGQTWTKPDADASLLRTRRAMRYGSIIQSFHLFLDDVNPHVKKVLSYNIHDW